MKEGCRSLSIYTGKNSKDPHIVHQDSQEKSAVYLKQNVISDNTEVDTGKKGNIKQSIELRVSTEELYCVQQSMCLPPRRSYNN